MDWSLYEIFGCRYIRSVNQGYSYCEPKHSQPKGLFIVEKCRVTVLKQVLGDVETVLSGLVVVL